MDTVRAILLFFYIYFPCSISTFCYFQIPYFHFHITLFKQILKPNFVENVEQFISELFAFLMNSSKILKEFGPNSDLKSSNASIPRLSNLFTKGGGPFHRDHGLGRRAKRGGGQLRGAFAGPGYNLEASLACTS